MDLRSGCPYWLIRNGLLNTFAPLDQSLECDVVVIGAGITGALVAWHLADAGFLAVVLDQREAAWGSTSASTALLQYEIDVPLHKLIATRGPDHAVAAYRACRDAVYKLRNLTARLPDACGFALRPSLLVAPDAAAAHEVEVEYRTREQHGFDVELLRSGDFQKYFPFNRPAGILSKDGGEVDPYRLAHQLLADGRRRGLQVYDRTKVTDYDLNQKRVVLRTDRGFKVTAAHVVFATGYETREFMERKIVDLKSTYALISEPLPAMLWHQDCLIWEHADPYLYLRTTSDHRVIVGGEDEPFVDPGKRDALLPAKTETLAGKFAEYFPRIPLEVGFAWAGTFGETKDGLAYIGDVPEFPRAFFTLGFGGNGITYSMLAAEIIRARLKGEFCPYSELFAFDR